MRVLLCLCLVLMYSTNKAQLKQLVWADEFNYTGLPDSAKWGYEVGHIRNQEKQYYMAARIQNSRVQNGCLYLTAYQEEVINHGYEPGYKRWYSAYKTANYTSASLITLHKASWQNFTLEIRAKMPYGQGVWPAFWLMGINRAKVGWPLCGEIDMMEYIGLKDSSTIHGSIHYPTGEADQYQSSGSEIKIEQPWNDFHTYSLQKTGDSIIWMVDQRIFHAIALKNTGWARLHTFNQPFYLIINLALGANWPGTVNNKHLPASLVVDYVRVYE
jgi:beta-glucanase (GH16 family)